MSVVYMVYVENADGSADLTRLNVFTDQADGEAYRQMLQEELPLGTAVMRDMAVG